MGTEKKSELGAFLFPEDGQLIDLKCFRGDRDDVSEAEMMEQLHNAQMQRRMKRAVVSARPPVSGVATVNVREFVAELAKS